MTNRIKLIHRSLYEGIVRPALSYYTLYQMAVCPGRVHLSCLAAGLSSCFLLRGPQGGGVNSTVQALAPAGFRGRLSRWSKTRDPTSNSGDGVPLLPRSHSRAYTPTRIFVFSAAKMCVFSTFAATATSAQMLLDFATTATTGVRVLLEPIVAPEH